MVRRGCMTFGEAYRNRCWMTSAIYQREWRARRRANRRKVCLSCRLEFSPARKDTKFCSDSCRFKAYRGRLAAAAQERARIEDLIAKARDRAFAMIG
jgi:hypothetical protein